MAVDDGKVTMEEAVTVDDGRDRTGKCSSLKDDQFLY